jgi:hypothetical protein
MTRALLTARIDAEAVPKGAKTRRGSVVRPPTFSISASPAVGWLA